MTTFLPERSSDETSYAAGYIGDDTLLASVWRTLSAPPLSAYLRFGEPQDPHGRERRAWSAALHAEVDALRARTYADGLPR